MNNFKLNVDRKVPDSEYIQSKQDFKEVLNRVAAAKTSIWHSTWFYGTVGMASIAILTTVSFLIPDKTNTYGTNLTPEKNQIATTQKHEVPADVKTAGAFSHADVEVALIQSPRDVRKHLGNSKKQTVPEVTPKKAVQSVEQKLDENALSETVASAPMTQKVVQEVRHTRPGMPNISGVFNGELEFSSLCEGAVEVNENVTVSSFLIQYSSRFGDRSQQIEGNKITPEVCREIEELGIDQMIFVTNITGYDASGKKYMVIPMNFTVVMD